MDTEVLTVDLSYQGSRLDQFLTQSFSPHQSRTYFQFLIEEGCVLLNGQKAKKRTEVKENDEVEVHFRLTDEISLEPENIPLQIIYEDEHLLVINKQAGLVVHPAVGHWSGTLVNALLYHCQGLKGGDSLRPGIVHRLDKDTTGALVVAKTAEAHKKLIERFSSRAIKKEYLAICVGSLQEGVISAPIGRHKIKRKQMAVVDEGREAVSIVSLLKTFKNFSLVSVKLITGRTHQIRVHLSHKGSPILGDPVYGSLSSNKKNQALRPYLHSFKLGFDHPVTNKPLEFEAKIPQDMQSFIDLYFTSL
jgi:23S rRNA pseudouridine1911/1915/1917 synthase